MSAARKSPLSLRGLIAAGAVLVLAGAGIIAAEPAMAATSLTVGTSADGDANGACSSPSITTTATPVTLRNALCVASNTGGESTVTVPAGTYELTEGALTLGTTTGTDVTLTSSGGRAEIVGDGSSQILTLDPNVVGGISVEIDGFAFTGGRDDVFGGGAIIGGNAGSGDPDALVIRDSVFTDNRSEGGTANPGGAVQFMGGDLTIDGSVFDANISGASGGAVYFNSVAGGDLEITGSTFRDNSVAVSGGVSVGGGAIAYDTSGTGTVSITGSTFTDNDASGTAAVGGAIQQVRGPATISKNVFSGNTTGAGGSAVDAANGALTARFNSVTGHAGPAIRTVASTTATATDNWWGCNGGPGAAGCDNAEIADGSTTPYLVLSTSGPSAPIEVGHTAELTASLRTDSSDSPIDGADLSAFDGAVVAWSDVTPSGSGVNPTSSAFASGIATTTFTAGGGGAGGAKATFGAASVPVSVDVRQAVAFTSANSASATTDSAFSFDVTAVGYPTPTITRLSGSLPAGLALSGSGASLTISGTPTEAGTFALGFQASNGGFPALQTLTLNVGSAPAFTGPLAATVADGEALDTEITASGVPAPAITTTTALPAGLTLDDNGDGTARLHGTPTGGPAEYTIGLSAENTLGSTTGTFIVTVTADPAFTSADHATFTVGTAGQFAVAIDPGFPVHDTVTLDGAPAWLSLTGAAGSQSLTGTPPVGAGGTYDLTLTIDGSSVTQEFTLTVREAPVITTQPMDVRVLEGTDAVFTASASGYPAPTAQWQRLVGSTWTDIDGETGATLSIDPEITDDGARVRAVFTSTAGTATTDEALLTVGQLPVIDEIDPVTAPVGEALSIDITSTGLPVGALTASALPAWLTFTDNGDGTAALTGTPALSDAGAIEVTVTADNGFGTDGTTVEITVVGALPVFIGSLDTTVEAGTEVDVTVTTIGVPIPDVTAVGSLPAGLELDDEGDGTARLHGTPTVAPGVYSIPLEGSNRHGTTQANFTLTITAPPAFTSADETTFTVGTAGEFAITVNPGYPTLNTVTLDGAPTWLSLTGAVGAQTLTGTPPVGAGGTYDLTLTIDGSSVSQDFTLTVHEAPVITGQPTSVSVLEGTDAVFTASASGSPAPGIQWQRLIGSTWTDLADEDATTLTIAADIADDGSRFRTVFANAAGEATTDEAVLTVGQLPVIDGIDPVTAPVGDPLSIDITTSGLPAGALTASALPTWLTFTDAGDGTAALTGTPALSDSGVIEVTVTVDNGFGTDDTTIEITVVGALPVFTGSLDTTVAAGAEVDVTLETTGVPTPAITAAGSLPAGLELDDEGDGTARLHGTPTVTPGIYSIALEASNRYGTTPTTFTLTITAPPAFTSAEETTFTVGTPGEFAVTVNPGHPALNDVSLDGGPAWLTLTGDPGDQSLTGTPPVGSGGTYDLELSIDGSAVVQTFTLTVHEAPVVTTQPTATTVLEGTDAVFTAAASGYPAPTVQWQRLVGGTWTDIDGETATTLTIEATIDDDGTLVRAAFASAAGDAFSDEVELTVGQLPGLIEIDPISTFAGAPLTIDITGTGLPASALAADDVPAWLTFTDAGDGTATLSGTPALTDSGAVSITIVAANGFGTATTTVDISVAATVPLPFVLLGTSDGTLSGVPDSVTRGQRFTIVGTGFLPGAVVEYGIYSAPTVLGTAVADDEGVFTAVVTIPSDQTAGPHTVAAAGISAEGAPRLLTSATTVVIPATDGGTGSGDGGSGLATTGADSSASLGVALLALLAVLGGLVLARGARRRMV